VKIYGGYSPDFANRDVLKYLTMVQPTPKAMAHKTDKALFKFKLKQQIQRS